MEDEVWKDPFATGTNRSETDRETKGFIISWDKIMNCNFNLSYTFDDINIDDDSAGNRNPYLKRDGQLHMIKGGSSLITTDTQELSSGIFYERADMSGKSYSYHGYGIELSHVYNGDGWELETGLSIGFHDHDRIHPEFSKAREEKIISLESAYTLHAPFGFKQYFITLFGSATLTDSNIGFYDDSSLTGGLGVGYEF
jgi:Protein of unknown function (DUF2860)